MKAILRNGDEQDALTRWRKYLHWHAGTRKKIKQRFNRRLRREARESVRVE